MTDFTTSLRLALPDFDISPWHDDVNNNFTILDAAFRALTGLITEGVWLNNTLYTVGQNVIDPVTGLIWTVVVGHTSAVAPSTFAQDRAANPTFWVAFTAAVANKGQWLTATPYNTNDFVYDANRFGVVTNAYTSAASYDADVAAGDILTLIDVSLYVNTPDDGYTYALDTDVWVRLNTAVPGGDWQWDSTVGGTPGVGFVRYNNATLASVTAILVNKTDAHAFAQSALIGVIAQPGVDLFFGSEKDENKWDIFNCIALPTDSGTFFTIPVTYKASGGSTLTTAEYCRLSAIGGAGSKVTTDDTAPVGPLDGQMWWRSNNGKLYVFYDDGAGVGQWVEASGADDANNSVNLAGYSTSVSNSAVQSIANGLVPTKVTNLIVVDYDPSTFWSVGSQRFQPTKAGVYLVAAAVGMTMEATKLIILDLHKNGVHYARLGAGHSNASGAIPLDLTGSIIVPMNGSTDYLELFVAHSNSVATNLNANVARICAFSAAYLGAAGMPQPTDETALQQNLVVNPTFSVSVENASVAAGTITYYAADQWHDSFSTSVGVISYGRVAVKTPRNSKYRLRMIISTIDASLAAGEYLYMGQKLEGLRMEHLGWNGSTGTQLVCRFGFKGPAGTYAFVIQNNGAARSWVSNFTISAGEANTDVEITKVIPADTSGGTWPSDSSSWGNMVIALAAGTTFHTTTDTWATGNFLGTAASSNGYAALSTFELFDVGLYADPLLSGLPPAWEAPLYADNIADCQRYFTVIDASGRWDETSNLVTYGFTQSFPVQMRAAPTMSLVSDGSVGVGTIAYSQIKFTNFVVTCVPTAAGPTTRTLNHIVKANARM